MPYIEKLEMRGFKSYGNRKVTIPFSKGFTAIVGANGSGKSNVGDAMLFVLGGLSAKAMRATRISDLIFAGTKKEPPAKYAEVSIYFNNEDRGFPIDEDEVVITRRVYPDGRSLYKLNGKRTSRSDILDLLSAAMISPEGYNLVLQGDITKFIKMSPTERRLIIDEISGIAEYDEKKTKAMGELKQAEENLARVDLLISEVKKQLDKLEKERNDALRYLDLKEKLEKARVTLLVGEIKRLERLIDEGEEKEEALREKGASIEERLKEIAKEIVSKEAELARLENLIESESSDELLAITRKISEVQSKIELAKRNIEIAKKEIEESNFRMAKAKEELKKVSDELEKSKSAINRWGKRREKLKAEIEEKEKERNALVVKLGEIDKNFRIAKEEFDKTTDELEEAKKAYYQAETNIGKFQEDIERLKARISTLNAKKLSLRSRIEELKAEVEARKEELSKVEASMNRGEGRLRKLEKEMEEKTKELSKVSAELESARKELMRAEAQQEAQTSNRAIEALKRSGIEGIHGALGELIRIRDERYAVAIEVALGSHYDNVVVDDDKVAERAINFLKKNRLGRLTFLPLNKIKPRKEPGVGTPAIELVDFDPLYKNAVSYAIGDTAVVEDMNEARSIGIGKARMVTLGGELLERSGAIVGGHYRPRGRFKTVNVEELKAKVSSLEGRKESLESALNALKLEHRGLERELFELRVKRSDLAKDVDVLQKELARLLEEDRNASEEIKVSEEAIKELEKKIEGAKSEMAKLEGRIERLEKRKEKLKKALDNPEARELNTKIREVEHELTKLKEEYSKVESRLESLEVRINEELIPRKADLEEEIEGLANRINAFKQSIEKNTADLEAFNRELEELKAEEEKLKGDVQKHREERDALRKEIDALREEKEKLREELQKVSLELNTLKIEIAQYRSRLEELNRELKHHDVSLVKEIPLDLEKLRDEIDEMEEEIKRLEPVNMKAIEDFEVVETRYLELKSKREQLEAEKESIEEFIAEIEGQKRAVFMQTLEAIAKNFSELFAKLSPGGEAKLKLENEEDPFSGGLEIEAKPAGKEVKRIEAMSGGEKALTALAFVFAIQRYKPAPFYLFDEIDAHLDDANVKRVADLIKEGSETSQFIVITLRDVMMANADKIIGVSMREGVSRVVSLSLEKAMEYLEKARQKSALGM
ncbi:chromosome segregation protein SMC [Palaeococcus ferrophilus]|uniref:chromosome segregation protein SMC n=1 Tax=Palaeococcus ferrophilus TaxID=83868 RepID=UPI00064FE482|nr:chromosome segregation protein SMC [Palaeococcus ferrophilus]